MNTVIIEAATFDHVFAYPDKIISIYVSDNSIVSTDTLRDAWAHVFVIVTCANLQPLDFRFFEYRAELLECLSETLWLDSIPLFTLYS